MREDTRFQESCTFVHTGTCNPLSDSNCLERVTEECNVQSFDRGSRIFPRDIGDVRNVMLDVIISVCVIGKLLCMAMAMWERTLSSEMFSLCGQ